MFRKIVSAALLAAVLPAAAMAGSSWTTSGVNFRAGPGTYYDVIGYLPHCAKLTTYGYDSGWVEVSWEGQRGWVSGKYLAESNSHCGKAKKKSGGYGGGY